MNKNDIINIKNVTDKLKWNFMIDKDNVSNILFSKYSPAGQDFSVTIEAETIEELAMKLTDYHAEYDVSEETYLWLDNTGHGKNGAPYDMKDVYEDMEECKDMLFELNIEIGKLADEA
jgi:hypothetical protein